jgi:nucleoside-diphosphate-sugar epimerase|tara:strand:+ start:1582 stop:2622 length:1041 start_codon:yes stop_codon:yes gene_type:complete
MVNKKILITGHNGYIGPLLVNLLQEKGFEVVGIDVNYFDDYCDFFPNGLKPFTQKIKDVRDIEESDLEGIYAVCQLAAISNDPMGELNPSITDDINYKSAIEIAKKAKKVGVKKFIYSSSCSLYGIAGDDALDETAELNPVTAYAKSKVATEVALAKLSDDDFCVTYLRNATAFGDSPKLRTDLVVNNLVGWAVTKGEIKIMSDGSPWRPLVHAEDIARAFVAMIETDASIINNEAFNVGMNTENFRIREVAQMVGEVVPNCEVVITGEHGSDSRTYRVNFDKIKNLVPAFQPKWTVKAGIEELYHQYTKQNIQFEDFTGRKFVRLKQLDYLQNENLVDKDLYFKK